MAGLIRKVWEAAPLLCPKCAGEMRIISPINERDVIERILRHLRLCKPSVRAVPGRDPPAEESVRADSDPWQDEDPFVDYEEEPAIMAS